VRKTLKTATTLEETRQIILSTTQSLGNLANIFDRLILEEKDNLLDRMEEAWEKAGGKQGYRSREDLKKHWRERERLDGFRYNILPHLWHGKDILKLVAKFQGHPRPGDRGHKEWERSLGNKTCEKCGGIWPARLRYFYSNGSLSELSPLCKNCQDGTGSYGAQLETSKKNKVNDTILKRRKPNEKLINTAIENLGKKGELHLNELFSQIELDARNGNYELTNGWRENVKEILQKISKE